MLIGVWATNPSVGDIFGQQLYLAITKSDAKNWGYTFIVLGICVQVVAVVNYVCLVEYPQSKGIHIKERATIFNPDYVE